MYFNLSFLLDEPEGHFKNIKARCTARYEGPQVVRGKSLQVVATFYDDKICNRFWVDPDQGYLPLQWFSYCQGCTDNRGDDGKVAAVHAILDIKECSGKRFIPTRAVYVQTEPDRGDGPYWLRYMQLVEFDAEKRPAPETFRLKVPFGTSISNGLSGVHYRANEPEYTDIDPDNLPEVTHEMADVTLSATLPPPTSSSFRMVWIAGVVLLNAIGVGLLGTWVYRNFVSRSAAGRR
jgi:hypothetical protein